MKTFRIEILVVDDDADIRQGTARLLEGAGYGVTQAATGEAALAAVQSRPPHLLLLDRALPGIDGLEVCRRVKLDPAAVDCFVVLASGVYAANEDQIVGLEAGADGYIVRPVANRDLLARVAAYARIVELRILLRHRTDELEQGAREAVAAQFAALNLMEDAVAARDGLERLNRELLKEIGERKRTEEAMRASAEHYRLLFETNPVPMWLHDLETLRFLAVNDAAVRHYGFAREKFLAMTIQDILSPEENSSPGEADRSAVLRSGEWRHRRMDGTIIRVEVVSSPHRFNGRAAQLVMATDITEKRLFEEKFLHAQRLESLGMLAAGIAHDLNNVLAPIMFAAPLLRDNLTSERDRKIIDMLDKSAGRGAALVRQILGFARTTSDQFQTVQVRHLARDIVGVVEETFPKSIEFKHSLPGDLWLATGNATQIHQVLLNLCVNARDAMPEGGLLRLTAANRRLDAAAAKSIPGARPGPWLVLEVSDTGTGIAPQLRESIWAPFFTTKAPGKGTGLGLSTVRTIVTQHGGFVELQTTAGRGSTFRVYLPAVENEPPQPSGVLPLAVPVAQGELILIVDDDGAICEIVSRTLTDRGYRVVGCCDGMEALLAFNARPSEFSLVLTDVDMPRLGGVALVRALAQLRPDLRLVGMSGLSRNSAGGSDVPDIQQVVHAFLMKPFTAADLLGTVDRLLHAPIES